eukprot:CAMPEP_0116886478 /NCGR_PEP_ID=MMETSP0463-20121206/20360_1 /TAXON_ID=181622 /ORGANISM="Strombidinopsis sp, Strain SopsisLIS2011" /LENGTH=64 /DNA_ID=CAMNT_0004547003 /DNA_START=330 /DNA_END=524 /DNA_ORIENTATION=-
MELENKLTKAYQLIEEKNLKIKEGDQLVNQMKLKQESEQALINGLQSEKNHLELTLNENVILKE